jgi:plasmid maintenance system antidote protein VapI
MLTMTDAKKYIKKNQQLPESVRAEFDIPRGPGFRDQLIQELAEAGWTYEAISHASKITRERVRQIVKGSARTAPRTGLEIPEPPAKPERQKAEYVEPHPDTLRRLLELQPYAQQVRANGSKYRQEAEEYTALLDHAHKNEGVTIYRLAKRLGITHGAIRFRLARYGYIQPKTGTSKVYNPILKDNRAV